MAGNGLLVRFSVVTTCRRVTGAWAWREVLAMGRVKTARDGSSNVVRAAIHPAIGIAPVGNSETGLLTACVGPYFRALGYSAGGA